MIPRRLTLAAAATQTAVMGVEKPRSADHLLPDFCSGRVVVTVMIMAELVVMLTVFVTRPPATLFWERFILLSLYMQWIAVCSAAVLCQARSWLQRMPPWFVLMASYVLLLGLAALLAEIAWFVLLLLGWQALLGVGAHDSFVIATLGTVAIVGLVALRYFWVQGQWRGQVEAEAEARYQALQARIRPHFLFNTLNSLAALIHTDARSAEAMVTDLADLFRVALERRQREAPLADELEITRAYLNIEQVRLGDRLQVVWEIDDDVLHVPVPLLSLQPLAENAVHHGITQLDAGGKIAITAKLTHEKEQAFLELVVDNPVPEVPRSSEGTRLALANLTERLRLVYGEHASLRTQRVASGTGTDAGIFRASIRIPVLAEPGKETT